MNKIFLTFLILTFLVSCNSKKQFEMILIKDGWFTLGLNPQNTVLQFMSDKTSSLNAQPEQQYFLKAFYIDKFEVTYEEFIIFKPQAKYPTRQINLPVRGVNEYEAEAYCIWIGKRLPTEYEWEKAARGGNNRLFVWGNNFEKDFANFGKQVMPVNSLGNDISSYGVWGMNGNVSEWTSSWYHPYPDSDHHDKNYGKKFKVTRGGSIQKRKHGFMKEFTMIPHRNIAPPEMRFWDTGFRCAKSV